MASKRDRNMGFVMGAVIVVILLVAVMFFRPGIFPAAIGADGEDVTITTVAECPQDLDTTLKMRVRNTGNSSVAEYLAQTINIFNADNEWVSSLATPSGTNASFAGLTDLECPGTYTLRGTGSTTAGASVEGTWDSTNPKRISFGGEAVRGLQAQVVNDDGTHFYMNQTTTAMIANNTRFSPMNNHLKIFNTANATADEGIDTDDTQEWRIRMKTVSAGGKFGDTGVNGKTFLVVSYSSNQLDPSATVLTGPGTITPVASTSHDLGFNYSENNQDVWEIDPIGFSQKEYRLEVSSLSGVDPSSDIRFDVCAQTGFMSIDGETFVVSTTTDASPKGFTIDCERMTLGVV